MLNFISSSFFCIFFRFFSRDDHIVFMHFISFCCLISLARYSNIILNRNSKSEHYYLVLNLRDKTFSLSPLKAIVAVEFHTCPLSGR